MTTKQQGCYSIAAADKQRNKWRNDAFNLSWQIKKNIIVIIIITSASHIR